MLTNIDLRDGTLIFENLSTYTPSPFTEDLLFIKYGKRYGIDIDWQPSKNAEGVFVIRVIEDCDWDDPLLTITLSNFDAVIASLQKAIDFTAAFIKEHPNRPIQCGKHRKKTANSL